MWLTSGTDQWIEVNIYRQIILRGIIVQGSPDDNYPYWTRTYRVKTSLGKHMWRDVVDEDGVVETFEGSWDRFAPVTHLFYQPIYAQYVRIFPRTKQGSYYALRFEMLGCPAQRVSCQDYLGMKNGDILLNQITSTSGTVQYARLDGSSGWRPSIADNSWLQVNLLRQTIVTGVIMQGISSRYNYYVKTYSVITSLDGFIWHNVTDEDGETEIFEGNWVHDVYARHFFSQDIEAQYIRILPVAWQSYIYIRMELLGCKVPTLECIEDLSAAALGLEDGRIVDGQLSASSGETSARYGRLNFQSTPNITKGGWIADTVDSNQWLQISLYRQTRIGGVIIQGRQDKNEWVTRYKVSSSLDGSVWEYVTDEHGADEVFEGSWDKDTDVIHLFHSLVEAQYVRIIPVEWNSHISLRLEILGCQLPVLPCNDNLGIENGTIADSQITALSSEDNVYPYQARLNSPKTWTAGVNDQNQWLQIDLYRSTPVTGVILQGNPNADQWVTRYHVMFSLDGKEWNAVVGSNFTIETFEGCWDRTTPAIHLFHEEVIAKYIRIHPLEWFGAIVLRLELLGCTGEKLPCVDPLGLEDGNITDSQLTASSKLNNDTSATSARLNHQPESPESQGAWVAEFDDQNQWIQASLLRQISITGVIVKGNPSTDKWVTRFQVQHSLNNVDWLFVKDGDGNNKTQDIKTTSSTAMVNAILSQNICIIVTRSDMSDESNKSIYSFHMLQVFPGSLDRDTPVTNTFQGPITAQYIRVVPTEWHGNISMRFELLGCQIDFTCLEPIGLEDYNITDEQILSSHYTVYNAEEGRLNGPRIWMTSSGGQRIEVNIYRQIILRGIIVQGSPDDTYPYWTKTYRVQTSLGNNIWRDVVDEDGAVETFEGSWDRFAPVTHLFYQPIYAQYVRIFPRTKQGSYYALRFEMLGCPDPFGMESGLIIDDQITASTASSDTSSAIYARYNQLPEVNGTSGAWIAGISDSNQWLQINLFRQMMVTGVNMQGNPSADWWVTRYKVETSLDHTIWEYVHDEYVEIEVFEGSYDRDTNTTHLFYEPVKAQYVRIRPVEWHGQISMRVELLGCPGNG
ncbi:uncharacterized protein [Amphiura filiformis]|uniref:uncharacterized protein n=1 Tax=Amphiura filiformis TaxID=82378 RepID=UPI003B21C9BC